MNHELTEANDFLAAISMKIAKYLSPQIYKSIFSGQKDVAITTERKKLTIFFSDIKDFTAHHRAAAAGGPDRAAQRISDRDVGDRAGARRHRRQVHRRRDPGLLRRPGDQGRGGGRARLPAHGGRHAAAARRSSTPSGASAASSSRSGRAWASTPAICNVGNFGSDDRMDYTIIGAEANLAARLQSIAEPGGIVPQLRDLCAGPRPRARAAAAADPR